MVLAAVALWTPPLVYLVAVDAGALAAPATGFPRLTDPTVVLAVAQVALMAASLPRLHQRTPGALTLLFWSQGAWCLEILWRLTSYSRLSGFVPTLHSAAIVQSAVALAATTAVLLAIRPLYGLSQPR